MKVQRRRGSHNTWVASQEALCLMSLAQHPCNVQLLDRKNNLTVGDLPHPYCHALGVLRMVSYFPVWNSPPKYGFNLWPLTLDWPFSRCIIFYWVACASLRNRCNVLSSSRSNGKNFMLPYLCMHTNCFLKSQDEVETKSQHR